MHFQQLLCLSLNENWNILKNCSSIMMSTEHVSRWCNTVTRYCRINPRKWQRKVSSPLFTTAGGFSSMDLSLPSPKIHCIKLAIFDYLQKKVGTLYQWIWDLILVYVKIIYKGLPVVLTRLYDATFLEYGDRDIIILISGHVCMVSSNNYTTMQWSYDQWSRSREEAGKAKKKY